MSRKPGVTAFTLVFAAVLAWSVSLGELRIWFDANGYWWSADQPKFRDDGGGFDLTAHTTPLRGYLAPLFADATIHLFGAVGIPDWLWMKAFLAATFSVIPTVLVPGIAQLGFGVRPTLPRRLFLAAVFIVFWRGYALYPLSDLTSLALALTACLLILRWSALPRPSTGHSRLAWLGAGMLLSASINVRPTYQALMPIVIVLGATWAWKHRSRVDPMVVPIWILVGFAIVAAPQVYLNVTHDRPANPLKFTTDQGHDLYWLLLDYGLRFPKYMTNVGDPAFKQGGVNASDPLGEELYFEMKACCADPVTGMYTTADYVSFVASNPARVGKIYVQHVFNGIDLWHSTPYLDRVLPLSTPFRVANLSLWFLASLLVVRNVVRHRRPLRFLRRHLPGVLVVGGLLLTVAVSVPGAVESRYYLPLHLLAYGIVAAAIPTSRQGLRWRPSRRTTAWAAVIVPVYVGFLYLALDQSNDVAARLYS